MTRKTRNDKREFRMTSLLYHFKKQNKKAALLLHNLNVQWNRTFHFFRFQRHLTTSQPKKNKTKKIANIS
ncbi:hypothetical protein COW86_02485 [Candidatus Kuenenbacteria bacterium CG22_combo_CG10-13_8_21_14_all_39_9]|uniref:Uncharacterized protein n=1 Tax=Candidatus Kuenenbacteria bacterium CG22_combo_CG10-13_8_21_14_all_39_9 TaxID=1974621 RepID=A0A2H0D130_9BACT|nr:MAG: hypothetical protein COW86_02485 [Candidatus Kuenenbacteria bacterium CG22_combo_CG10-13_8_21_14_all_39_9]